MFSVSRTSQILFNDKFVVLNIAFVHRVSIVIASFQPAGTQWLSLFLHIGLWLNLLKADNVDTPSAQDIKVVSCLTIVTPSLNLIERYQYDLVALSFPMCHDM